MSNTTIVWLVVRYEWLDMELALKKYDGVVLACQEKERADYWRKKFNAEFFTSYVYRVEPVMHDVSN